MNRVLIAIVILGGFIAYNGTQELKLAEGATLEPLSIELAEIEAGHVPDNPHLRIGGHWVMNHELVFSYQADRGDSEEDLAGSQRLDFSYYPIVAPENDFFAQLEDLEQLYGSLDEVPEERLPELSGFSVLVRTERYERLSDLPEPAWAPAESVTGMVANQVRSLSSDEAALVQEGFPGVDVSQLLILEEGRQPKSATQSYTRIGGGALLALSPLAFLVVRARRRTGEPLEDATSDEMDSGRTDDEISTGPGPIA